VGGAPPPINPTLDPVRIRFREISLSFLVGWAYDFDQYRISRPEWCGSAFYDLEGVFPAGATIGQFRAMVQALLEERLSLRTHREMKEMLVRTVVIAAGGLRMSPAKANAGPPPNFAPYLTRTEEHDVGVASIATLIRRVMMAVGGPVVDKTGLEGEYEIDLRYALDPETRRADTGSLASAMEKQLGLKLEERKGPAEVLVVDHAERTPAEN
jgi:uncharacterized protein (TIGR03435 family)